MDHFTLGYARFVNGILHRVSPNWWYKHEIYEVPGVATALFISHENQRKDEFQVNSKIDLDTFIVRIRNIVPEITSPDALWSILQQSEQGIVGWRRRTIFFVKAGSQPENWSVENGRDAIMNLLRAKAEFHIPIMELEANVIEETIPVGREHWRVYEDFVRRVIDTLFFGDLGYATPQVRSEPGDDEEGIEIRDLLCQNKAEAGFWKDLKDKYQCTEVLFEAKNKEVVTRDDLRQTYCYLKPAIGLWGFIVCRKEQPSRIKAYVRTLFSNFTQGRGVLILTDDDIQSMLQLKKQGHDPATLLRDRMSEFTRGI